MLLIGRAMLMPFPSKLTGLGLLERFAVARSWLELFEREVAGVAARWEISSRECRSFAVIPKISNCWLSMGLLKDDACDGGADSIS